MIRITNLTANSKQNFTMIGENGESITFLLKYYPTQTAWYFDITFDDFTTFNLHLTVSPNALRNFKNLLPFGLGCFSADGFDPSQIDDFTSGNVELFLLNDNDKEEVEDLFFT